MRVLEGPGFKLQALLLPQFSQTKGSSLYIQGLESRGDSSRGGNSKKGVGKDGAGCLPIWFLKQGRGPMGDRRGGGWLRLLLLHRK